MWLFSRSTVQFRKQLMIWSSYFWLGALMTSVTGPSSAPESMTPEEPELRRANGSGPPQIILDLVVVGGWGGVWGFPLLQRRPHVWRRSEVPTVSTGRREEESEAVWSSTCKNNLLSGTRRSPVMSRPTSPTDIPVWPRVRSRTTNTKDGVASRVWLLRQSADELQL